MMRAAKVRNFLPLRLVLLFLDHSIDMDVSDDAPLDNDEVSSEPAGGLEDDASGSENNQDDDIEVEDIGQDAIAEEEEEEEEDEVSFHSILSYLRGSLLPTKLSESPPTPPPKPMKAKTSPQKPRLKIKLKLSGVPQNTTPTPSDEMPLRPGRKGHPKRKRSRFLMNNGIDLQWFRRGRRIRRGGRGELVQLYTLHGAYTYDAKAGSPCRNG